MKFKDAKLQKKHGKTLEKLFAKHVGKLEILDTLASDEMPDNTGEPMTEAELDEMLDRGDGVYWSLKRDKHVNVIGVKPFVKSTVVRNLYLAHKKAEANKFKDLFYGTNPQENLR